MTSSSLLFQNNKDASASSLLLFRNNIIFSSADISNFWLYALNMKTSINDLISVCYNNNKNIQDMLTVLRNNFIQQWFQFLRKKLQIVMSECKIIENWIYYHDYLLVSKKIFLRFHIMMRTHSFTVDSHVDYRKTIDLVKKFYVWHSMTKNIDQFIHHCHFCTRFKVWKKASSDFLKSFQISFWAWSDIFINYIVNLSKCEHENQIYRHILVMINCLTKMQHFILCITLKADELIIHFIATVYYFHELSENIVSDRNSQFISMLWRIISKKLKMTLKSFSAFHLQINNQTEIANVFLEQYFWIFMNFVQNNWVS